MSSITHHQTKNVVAAGAQVVDTVTAAVDIPAQLFVMNAGATPADDTFNRVASVADILNIAAVRTDGQALYRVDSVTRNFEKLHDATEFANMLRDRLRQLPADWDSATGWARDVTETFTA